MRTSRAWMLLGVAALLVSGALSILVTGAKVPLLRPFVTDLELIRRSLVIHVNLATLVWFTAIPLALTQRARPTGPSGQRARQAAFLVASFGIVLMIEAAFLPGSNAVLANYIPVLTHPLHDWGLGLYFLGVAQTYLSPSFLFPSGGLAAPAAEPSVAKAGITVGGLFFLAACAALLLAFPALEKTQFSQVKTYFEIGMWGGGHLLQHASAVFLVVCWGLQLRGSSLAGGILEASAEKWVFVLMAAPLTILPFLFALPPWGNEYRDGFTQMMRWGIAPPMLLHAGACLWLLARSRRAPSPEARLARSAWGFSVLLALLGFTFGAFIRGPDLRVPGHYHATIGAVTIMFMLVAYRSLFPRLGATVPIRGAIWCYGIGQCIFSGGMFTAGLFGVQRKTYGAEHVLTNGGQVTGMAMIAGGGLIALAGGLLYGLALYRAWRLSAASGAARERPLRAPGLRSAAARRASGRYSSALPPTRG